jgi:hypothetical protein
MIQNTLIFSEASLRVARVEHQLEKSAPYSHTYPQLQQTAKMVEKVYVTYNDVCPREQPYNPSTGTCFVLDREVNERSY